MMDDRVFCIDFGSGFTKVGLRAIPSRDSALLNLPGQQGGGVEFCLPSAVMAEQRDIGQHYEFGYDALGYRTDNRYQLFTNWKGWAFEAGQDQPAGLEAMLQSADFAALAGRYQVSLGQVKSLQYLVEYSRGLVGAGPVSPESLRVRRAKVLADKFFRFLREFTLKAAERLDPPLPNAHDIPVVLAVPAFAPEAELPNHPGVQLLTRALAAAGWPLRQPSAVISEPLANAIGVLTGGCNSLRTTKASKNHPSVTRIDLAKMFGRGPILTAMKDGKFYPLYRALIVDVGAFTTDVAVVELPTHELVDYPAAGIRIRQQSVALGVRNLDEQILAVLPGGQRTYMQTQATARDWEDFRPQVYTDGKPFKTIEVVVGTKAEQPAIKSALGEFGRSVASRVSEFCGDLQPANMQELILTGGGNYIPAVRTAIEAAVALPGSPIVRVSSPTRKTGITDAVARQLDTEAVRGGTALGGASIYFEPKYW